MARTFSQSGMRYRVLIFDDDPSIRLLLFKIFDGRGYQAFVYPDPELCPLAEELQCPCPEGTLCADVIVSDVDMLKNNGIDFLESLVNKGCKGPHFALISGTWSKPEEERAARLGCHVFRKPLDVFELLEWIESAEVSIFEKRLLFDWHRR